MASIGSLVVNLGANLQGLQKGLQKAQGMVGSFASRTASAVSSAVRSAAGITATLGAGGLTAGLVGAVKMAADVESLAVQFEVLTGSADKARNVMQQIRQFAAETPFETGEIAQAARQLIAFGSNSETVVSELRMLGDIASGIGQPLGEIAEIYGKARVQGRLFGEDINQLTGRGIPVIGELARQFGVAESEVKKLVEDGRVGFPELQRALQSLTSNGGRFSGMMQRMSQTTAGKFSTMVDYFKAISIEIGTALLPAVNSVMTAIISGVDEFNRWGESGEGAIGGIMRAIKNGDMQAAFKLVVLELKLMWTKMVSDFIVSWMEAARKINRTVNWHVFSEDEITAAIIGAGTDVANVKDEISKLRHEQFWAAQKAMNGAAANPGDMPAAAMAQAVANGEGGGIDPFFGLKNPLQRPGAREASSGAFDLAAAMQRGSAEAYSTLVRAGRRDNADPAAQAVDKQTKALLQPLNQLAGAFVGGLPGVLIVESF